MAQPATSVNAETDEKQIWRGRELGVAVGHPLAQGRPGIEVLRAVMNGELPAPPINRAMAFWMAEVERGRVVFEGEPGWDQMNPMGGVHGGWALTLIDSATGCAAHSTLDAGVGYTTLETKANMTKAIRPESGVYRCEGKVIVQGRQVITTDAVITGPDGKIYAHGTSTLLVLQPR